MFVLVIVAIYQETLGAFIYIPAPKELRSYFFSLRASRPTATNIATNTMPIAQPP